MSKLSQQSRRADPIADRVVRKAADKAVASPHTALIVAGVVIVLVFVGLVVGVLLS